MKLVTDLTNRDVIHCSTVQQYDRIVELLVNAGLANANDIGNWYDNKTLTCVFRNGSQSYLNYCIRKPYNVFSADLFLPKDYDEAVTVYSFESGKAKRGLLSKMKSLFGC